MIIQPRWTLPFLACLLCCASARTQAVVHDVQGLAAFDRPATGCGRVAVDGDRILIGSEDDRGTVYVFRRKGAAYLPEQAMTPSGVLQGEGFGSSVSIHGDVLVSGAPSANSRRGAVIIYRFTNSEWVKEKRIQAPLEVTHGEYFGTTVAIHGDWLVVAAPQHQQAGAAYIYHRIDGVWTETQKVTSIAIDPWYFGLSLDVNEDWMAIGTLEGDLGTLENPGVVTLLKRDGDQWNRVGDFTSPDAREYDAFGCSVSLDGHRLLVGAAYENSAMGAAYLYSLQAGSWNLEARLDVDIDVDDGLFGSSVSLLGNRALVGGLYEYSRCAGLLLEYEDGQWQQTQKLVPARYTTSCGNDLEDPSVALLDDDRAVVGSLFHQLGQNQTLAKVFAAKPLELTISPAVLDPDDDFNVSVTGGTPGAPAQLYLVSVDAAPVFLPTPVAGYFDAERLFTWSGSRTGFPHRVDLEFQAFTPRPDGALARSNRYTLSLR